MCTCTNNSHRCWIFCVHTIVHPCVCLHCIISVACCKYVSNYMGPGHNHNYYSGKPLRGERFCGSVGTLRVALQLWNSCMKGIMWMVMIDPHSQFRWCDHSLRKLKSWFLCKHCMYTTAPCSSFRSFLSHRYCQETNTRNPSFGTLEHKDNIMYIPAKI